MKDIIKEIIKRIADSELEILKVLWKNAKPMSVSEIKKAVLETMQWEDSTIKTLVSRLCKKEVLKAEKDGIYKYTTCISEEQYNEYKTQEVIDHLYNGSAKNLVASLVQTKKLTEQDRAELLDLFKVE